MMSQFEPHLRWVAGQQDRMLRLLGEWARINSGSRNLDGLRRMATAVEAEFGELGGEMQNLDLRPQVVLDERGQVREERLAKATWVRKRPGAPLRVFLGIHMDTVYGSGHAFQNVELIDGGRLRGPGVADAKGGLVVMLVALEALERTPWAASTGWEVLINPDEEIGSPGSAAVLADCARRNDLGMVFEPAFSDGAMVGARKGSGNFSAVVRGKSAHAGRDFHLGRNAVLAAAEFAVAAAKLNGTIGGVTVNVGRIDGGGPLNVVPDLAVCRINVRVATAAEQKRAEEELRRIAGDIDARDGIHLELHGGFSSPPKPVDEKTAELMGHVAACGEELGLGEIAWRGSGGVSDGNKLAAAGLTVVDTFGVRGGNLHSAEEFMVIDSLTERAQLAALLLMKLAAGEIPWPRKAKV
jgi:glutamate carboxypeptidase